MNGEERGEVRAPPGGASDTTDPDVDDNTAATVVDTPNPRVRPPPAERAATRLGHFHLLEPLGEGGMGAVYSAYDLTLDRKVAIKVLAERDLSPSADRNRQQRLLREAQAMAKLSHPNVVPVYEVGVSDGDVFIAMEHVSGQTLGEWREETERSWREILDVFVQAARGLAAAHEAGIVHRDFKPSNVLVEADGRARVVDFGIAKLAGELEELPGEDTEPTPRIDLGDDSQLTPPAPSTPLTAFGSMVGTPAYMSPEQYRCVAVDARSDQFSFCVALYEALYGERPFAGRGDELAANVKAGACRKPSSKAVPGWIAPLVTRGLASQPEDRFASMAELADALSRDPARARRRVAAFGGGALGVAAVALMVGLKLSGGGAVCQGAEAQLGDAWDEGRRAALGRRFQATEVPYAADAVERVSAILDRYRGQWIDTRTRACKATRLHREQSERVLDLKMACLDDRLAELRALTDLLTGPVDAAIVEHAVKAVTALTPVDGCDDTSTLLRPDADELDAAARQRRREMMGELEQLRAARRVGRVKPTLEPARALLARAEKSGDALVIAHATRLVGALEMNAGELEEAEQTLGDAISRALALGEVDLMVTASIDLISTLAEGGIMQSRDALGVIRLVEALVDDAHDPSLAIRLAREKANEHMVLARPDRALPILDETLAKAREVLGPQHIQVLALASLRASALGHSGKHDEALEASEQAIAASTKILGALHPETLTSRVARCRVLADAKKLDKGAACFSEAIARALPVLGAHHRELLSFRSYHGMTLRMLGRDDEARRVYTAAYRDIPESAWAGKWFIAADIARALGSLENDTGHHAEALEHCEKARSISDPRHAGINDSRCIADALLGLGRADEALAILEPMLETVEGAKSPMHLGASRSQVGLWRFAYARALWAVKKDRRAREIARVARAELGDPRDVAHLDEWLGGAPR